MSLLNYRQTPFVHLRLNDATTEQLVGLLSKNTSPYHKNGVKRLRLRHERTDNNNCTDADNFKRKLNDLASQFLNETIETIFCHLGHCASSKPGYVRQPLFFVNSMCVLVEIIISQNLSSIQPSNAKELQILTMQLNILPKAAQNRHLPICLLMIPQVMMGKNGRQTEKEKPPTRNPWESPTRTTRWIFLAMMVFCSQTLIQTSSMKTNLKSLSQKQTAPKHNYLMHFFPA